MRHQDESTPHQPRAPVRLEEEIEEALRPLEVENEERGRQGEKEEADHGRGEGRHRPCRG
jgi:hypothetical protein